jgi:L-glyceraldehyde 3-phosphate reductase
LATAVQQGKALYAGISAYSPEKTRQMAAVLRAWHVPLLIHQPAYSILNRKIEGGLFEAVEQVGAGMIAFSPLAQGVLSSRYLGGIPTGSRATHSVFLKPDQITPEVMSKVRALNELALARGQTLAQLALAWVLRDPRMTSALIGASSVEQLRENLAALRQLTFSADELAAIDRIAPA